MQLLQALYMLDDYWHKQKQTNEQSHESDARFYRQYRSEKRSAPKRNK